MCRTHFSQAMGLMFSKKQNLIMIFPKEKKVNLHMFFVFFPIDVLIVDSQKSIVEIKRNFRPFTFWNSSKKGRLVVELSEPGDYSIGDEVEFS